MAITILKEAPSFEGAQVRYTEQAVSAHILPSSDLIKHPGTLTITDESVYFYSPQSAAGFAIPYPAIIIHATARESPYGPSIYCQIDGSLQSGNGITLANGTSHGDEDDDEEEDSILEIYFTPSQPTTLDSIYENLSYCVSLHPDGDADFDDDDDMYEDDEDDHDALYMEADIQGGYTPRNTSNATTSIGMPSANDSSISSSGNEEAGATAAVTAMEVPGIDPNSGEWFTGNPETDAKFELSEEGKANLERMEKMLQDPHRILNHDDSIPTPDEEEPGQDAEEDRFKDPATSL